MEEGDEGQLQMAALQAQAIAKGSDFETRKRARLTEEFQSTDKGGRQEERASALQTIIGHVIVEA